jgi:hypothetical protein
VNWLHCKGRSHSVRFSVVKQLKLHVDLHVSSVPGPDLFIPCFYRSRLNDDSSESIFFSCLPMSRNRAVGGFLPRHRSSVKVVYKMNLSNSVNILFLCIVILNFCSIIWPLQGNVNKYKENVKKKYWTSRRHANRTELQTFLNFLSTLRMKGSPRV